MPAKVGMVTFQGNEPYEMPMTLFATTCPANGQVELLLTLDTSLDGLLSVQVQTRLSRATALALAISLTRTLDDLS